MTLQYYKNPDAAFEVSWGVLLGQPKVAYAPYRECKAWARKSGIKSQTEWRRRRAEIPDWIPRRPDHIFGRTGEWESWGEFFGTGRRKRGWDYEKFKQWVRTRGFKTRAEFYRWVEQGEVPAWIPRRPHAAFALTGEWEGWGPVLGTGPGRGVITFVECRDWARGNKIKSEKEWQQAHRDGLMPPGFTRHPDRTFKTEWSGWPAFVGK